MVLYLRKSEISSFFGTEWKFIMLTRKKIFMGETGVNWAASENKLKIFKKF